MTTIYNYIKSFIPKNLRACAASGYDSLDKPTEKLFTTLKKVSFKEAIKLIENADASEFEIKDENGNTPLLYAIKYNPELALHILKKTVNVNVQDAGGKTALMYPLIFTHLDNIGFIQELIKRKDLDFDIKDETNRTAMDYFFMFFTPKTNINILDILIDNSNRNIQDALNNALKLAIAYLNIPMIDYLLKRGADCNAIIDGKHIIFHLLDRRLNFIDLQNALEIANILISRGLD